MDVPGFDRSAMDGYAIRAEDTYSAEEDRPVKLMLRGRIEAGQTTNAVVSRGEAVEVSTGAPIPRGANAVIMVEYTMEKKGRIDVFRSVSPNENITSTGSDVSVGETVLRQGAAVTYRAMGVLAAIGQDHVKVYIKPRVVILSTGGELVPPGSPIGEAQVYDINSYSLFSAVLELGCSPIIMGVVGDEEDEIRSILLEALDKADVILTSGSTSAGFGDMIYKVFEETEPGSVLIHGLTVKPGKPTVIARIKGKPVFGLPGYPASAMTIFNAIVKPYLISLLGLRVSDENVVQAKLAVKTFKAKGRREFLPVHLIRETRESLTAYPILKGSGAISSFSLADGYLDVPADAEFMEEGEMVNVHLYSSKIKAANLVLIGSHCPAADLTVSMLLEEHPEYRVKMINVGSRGGLNAALHGEADIAGIHLLDRSGIYNKPFIDNKLLSLVRGYSRQQGFIFRKDVIVDGVKELVEGRLMFTNRTKGSGTRILIESLIDEYCKGVGLDPHKAIEKIQGFNVECKTHSAVASAIKNGRADIGVGVRAFAEWYGLNFNPIALEAYDFAVRKDKMNKSEVKAFIKILKSARFKAKIETKIPGLSIPKNIGERII